MAFQVRAEEYAELLLEGSQQYASGNDSAPLHAWISTSAASAAVPLDCADSSDVAQRGGVASCPQVYAAGGHLVRLVNVVINLRDGNISSFAWDNGCAGCGPSDCMESSKSLDLATGAVGGQVFDQGTCGQRVENCPSNPQACDLRVFVTWAGTDRNGRNAVSAGMRLSKFTGYTMKSLYESMAHGYHQVASR